MWLIDGECLCDLVEQSSILSSGFKQVFRKLVAGEPTVDAVPVVRCRECKNWKPYGSKAARNAGDPLERYGGCEICNVGRLESDFCSYGKEREKTINSAPLNQEERWLKTV